MQSHFLYYVYLLLKFINENSVSFFFICYLYLQLDFEN